MFLVEHHHRMLDVWVERSATNAGYGEGLAKSQRDALSIG